MDDEQSQLAPDTVTRLIELFQKNFGDEFKSYWQAWPLTTPMNADLPALIFQKEGGKAVIGPTSTDDITEIITITALVNTADDVGSTNIKTTTMRHVQNMIEGQDPVTLDYRSNSVLYILRTYLTLLQESGSVWLIDSDASVKYQIGKIKDGPALAIGEVTMTTQRRVIVSGRT